MMKDQKLKRLDKGKQRNGEERWDTAEGSVSDITTG